ncbi:MULTISPECIES: hypothetical protein [Bacteroidaceae]|uniref:hypothetical protein n=1 Tax=Bacteroidaceae TaxID=815 RepID=UPI00189E9900|nr:hypothetical protein [Phocaeicola vulgatus]MDB1048361.1 hypothetical protein [Phocaeicola vulgatus]MDB1052772.1 hypothetical protein [Phocaeicola vulgatus]
MNANLKQPQGYQNIAIVRWQGRKGAPASCSHGRRMLVHDREERTVKACADLSITELAFPCSVFCGTAHVP